MAKAEGEILFVLKYDVAKGSKIVRIMVNLVYIKSKSHSRRISEKYGNRVEFIRAGGVIRQKISRSLLLGKNRPGPNWPRIISITSVRRGRRRFLCISSETIWKVETIESSCHCHTPTNGRLFIDWSISRLSALVGGKNSGRWYEK